MEDGPQNTKCNTKKLNIFREKSFILYGSLRVKSKLYILDF